MTDLLTQYGPIGGLIAVAFLLAGAVGTLVKQRRNGHGHAWDGTERRAAPPRIVLDFSALVEALKPLLDVRADFKELRADLIESRHEIRGDLQPLVAKVAVLEKSVTALERRAEREGR